MLARRASVRYRVIEDDDGGADLGDGAMRDIELAGYHDEGRHERRNDMDVSATVGSHVDAANEALASHIAPVSHDNDFLIPSKRIQHRDLHREKPRFLTGWRVGALASCIGATTVCIVNMTTTIVIGKRENTEGSIATLYSGDCKHVKNLNIWAHVLVNILSTLLLCASNYCMQVLSAPTRAEVDRVHAQRRWLHIGVPSLGNLQYIARDRKCLWRALFVSSVPLHLLFNSVVFANLQANEYAVVPTTESWLYGGEYDVSNFVDLNPKMSAGIKAGVDAYRVNLTEVLVRVDGTSIPRWRNLSTAECFSKYDNQYVTEVGTVYLVQNASAVWRNVSWSSVLNYSIPYHSSPKVYPSNTWRCQSHNDSSCDVDNEHEVAKNRSMWAPYESLIRYCIVEQVEEVCKLQFSFPIALIVILANFVKAVCTFWTLFGHRSHAALATLGDAIASFLEHPDVETKGRCLYDRNLVEARWSIHSRDETHEEVQGVKPIRYASATRKWGSAPSSTRWITTYTGFLVVFVIGIIFLQPALQDQPKDIRKLWKTGFGAVNGNNLFTGTLPQVGGVLVANLPQALLAYMYIAFNALYTNMLVAYEWSTYINERKPLRVTCAAGQQRDTYWLNIPYRFAIPFTITSGVFHWLASQSLFMVRIVITDERNRARAEKKISTCGYSPMALILTVVVASILAGYGIVLGYWRYAAGMPLASSCSAAISAACHVSSNDASASLQRVQWGALSHGDRGEDGEEPVGRCCFSSLPVEPPIVGRLYA